MTESVFRHKGWEFTFDGGHTITAVTPKGKRRVLFAPSRFAHQDLEMFGRGWVAAKED